MSTQQLQEKGYDVSAWDKVPEQFVIDEKAVAEVENGETLEVYFDDDDVDNAKNRGWCCCWKSSNKGIDRSGGTTEQTPLLDATESSAVEDADVVSPVLLVLVMDVKHRRFELVRVQRREKVAEILTQLPEVLQDDRLRQLEFVGLSGLGAKNWRKRVPAAARLAVATTPQLSATSAVSQAQPLLQDVQVATMVRTILTMSCVKLLLKLYLLGKDRLFLWHPCPPGYDFGSL